ncbi:FAD-dependent oxidoreductase [Hymenobacter oligotrophus]|uniref:Tryptophan 2-monooxygenase n=1 Tax=Hymenobacter oligotrophus TaxID=2319843 RepID=A0A3B7QW57_9BACT|nr:NAD(P)/FAD-dependent oxidoreductase [Hymenobacter oligotrophus]AYA36034.1 FAD-dependent oxidoreductase [Hymenobacter oligotrophus]
MTEAEILIVGGGAAGLMAARELSQAGKRVVLLEARPRLGGRIHTFCGEGFTAPTEAGAEFMHGEVPLTRALLAEAGIACHDTAGEVYEVEHGRAQVSEGMFEELPALLEHLHTLEHDMPLADYLTQYFAGEQHAALRTWATRFAEGYDAADAQRVSVLALRDEWTAGGAEDSPRPVGGYSQLIDYLARGCQAAGAAVHLGHVVQTVRWQPGRGEVLCTNGQRFAAPRLLLTLPLGVLQATSGQHGHVAFEPELPHLRTAAHALGFGPVIKVLLEFDTAFWETAAPGLHQPLPAMGFVFSDAPVPTWWSQLPDGRPLLTGWVAGPAAHHLRHATPEAVLQLALESVAYLLGSTVAAVRAQLVAHKVANWGADAYALGAYTYATVGGNQARAALAQPVADTLFFAGEAVYEGPAMGTVEAALVSGQQAARQLLAQP